MSEIILDDLQEVKAQLKNRQNFAGFWLLYAIGFILYGVSTINQHSTAGLLAFMMVPISSAYAAIITGIWGLFISKKIKNNESSITESLFLFLGTTFFFYLGDCFRVGASNNVNLNDYLFEIFKWNYLINIILIIITYRSVYEKEALKELIKTRKKYFLLILIGLIPALLAQVVRYESFSFLHP
jgi:hypothetical protein